MKKFLPLIIALFFTAGLHAQTDLFISEYIEGWSNNRAIEIYNPTANAINLKDYRLARYSNGSNPPASSKYFVELPDLEVEPYKTIVFVTDKRDPKGTGLEAPIWRQLQERTDVFLCPDYAINSTMYHSGDDAVALEKLDATFVDLFARFGLRPAEAAIGGSDLSAMCWTDTWPHDDGVGLGITADHTMIRKSNIVAGVTSNPLYFDPLAEWDSLSANTFYNLGWHKCDAAPANATPVFGQEEYVFNVWKQATEGTRVATLTAIDAENDALKYHINTGNYFYYDIDESTSERVEPFSINVLTGEITLTEAKLNNCPWDTIQFTVSATDGYSQTEKWANILVVLSDTEVSANKITVSSSVVYPSVTRERIINVETVKSMKSIAVYGVTGAVEKQIDATNLKQQRISLNDSKAGIYFVKINYSDLSSETKRIILQ